MKVQRLFVSLLLTANVILILVNLLILLSPTYRAVHSKLLEFRPLTLIQL
jgi:hypothetical protein